jgi:hypothetical protein
MRSVMVETRGMTLEQITTAFGGEYAVPDIVDVHHDRLDAQRRSLGSAEADMEGGKMEDHK